MEGKSIHLRVSDEMLKEFNAIKGAMGFSSIQEFLKDAMRKAVLEYRRHAAMRTIKKLQGSVPYIKRPTQKDREKLVEQFFEEKARGRDIFKEYGLK